MGKRILLVTGSPRKHGNSEMMADAFTEGAALAGHTVMKFEAAFHEMLGCRACDTCWSRGVPCSFDDGFNTEFAPLLEQADALVLCMPLYFYGFPAQLKAALDKMYSYAVPNAPKRLKIKESAFMICGGDREESVYNGAVESYRQMARYCDWKDRGILVAFGVFEKGAIRDTAFLETAKALGASF